VSITDPTDDELEREAARDVSLAAGGTARHAPRLSDEPRGINLAEMRGELNQDRAVAAMRDQRAVMGRTDSVPEGLLSRRGGLALAGGVGALDGALSRYDGQSAPRSPLAPRREVRPEATIHDEGFKPSPLELARAWDQYASAALALCEGQEDPEGAAGLVADRMLEERKRRFG
jgi:hypothetical protein